MFSDAHPERALLRQLAAGVGITVLITVPMWVELLLATGSGGFYAPFDRTDAWALCGITVACVLIASLAQQLHAGSSRVWRLSARIVLALLAIAMFGALTNILEFHEADGVAAVAAASVFYLVGSAATVGLMATERIRGVAMRILSGYAFSSLLGMIFIAKAFSELPEHSDTFVQTAPKVTAPATRRLVYIVFDELDSTAVPLDAGGKITSGPFRGLLQGARAYAAKPTGWSTRSAMSSILTGQLVAELAGTRPSTAKVRLADSSLADWAMMHTIFDAANAEGVRWSVIGWFLPYCRLLAAMESRACAWSPFEPFRSITSSPDHFAESVNGWLTRLLPTRRVVMHAESVQETMVLSLELASDPATELVLIHARVPHEPYVFDRVSREYRTTQGNYLENVELSAIFLKNIIRRLQKSGVWDRTTVVVTSDHPLRNPDASSVGSQAIPLLIRIPNDTARGAVVKMVPSSCMVTLLQHLTQRLRSPEPMTAVVDAWERKPECGEIELM